MAYRIEPTDTARQDLEDLVDYLISAHRNFGHSHDEAIERASSRAIGIRADMAALATIPHQGTLRPELGVGIRNVTKNRAVFYFQVDDTAEIVRVLSIFYGGQDHLDVMRKRLA